MKRTQYNIPQICKKCGRGFLKTATTGNQCRSCRRRNCKWKNKPKNSDFVKLAKDQEIRIEKFILKVNSKAGYIYSLNDLNELIESWQVITPNYIKYDALPTNLQIFEMWNDLKKWYNE